MNDQNSGIDELWRVSDFVGKSLVFNRAGIHLAELVVHALRCDSSSIVVDKITLDFVNCDVITSDFISGFVVVLDKGLSLDDKRKVYVMGIDRLHLEIAARYSRWI